MAEINLAALLGGVGLFLLGMTMMSGGLKLSLGPALTRRLRDWTNGRLRGLLFGSVATALMQSSTATTVATIGFVKQDGQWLIAHEHASAPLRMDTMQGVMDPPDGV